MPSIEVKNFDSPDEVRPFEGKGKACVVNVGDRSIVRSEFESGWRWSNNVKPIAQTDSCEVKHLGYCISGRMRITMSDGTTAEVGPGDAVAVQPGHDAEVISDEPCLFIDFGDVSSYAKTQ